MSTFSYAQAAKGVSGTPSPSKAPSESEKTESKLEEQTPAETTTDVTPAPTEPEASQKPELVAEESKDDDFTTVTSKHAAKSKAIHSRTSSPSVRTASKARKSKEDDSNTPNGNADATAEKQAPKEGQTEKAEGAAEKLTEKSEDSEKTAPPPKELKAAPLPSVNIWQQRREAQDAKAKAAPKPSTNKAASDKDASTADEAQDSKTGSKKKGGDSTQEGAKDRKKTEGGKGRDAGKIAAFHVRRLSTMPSDFVRLDMRDVPSVEDATAWPTPQVALGEEKKKAHEKTDKSPVIRPHGKEKWTPVPYVPTAVFNTPLPSAGARGGRRATRGGRDSGRGAHGNGAAATDKAASGQAAQGVKQTSGERGRQESGTGRAASLPAQSRRSNSTDAAAATDARKTSQAPERSRAARNGEDNTSGKQVNGGENVPRSQREGKPFGRNQDARAGNQKGGSLAVDSQAAARNNDRRFEAGSKSADPTGFNDLNRERGEFRSERGGRGSNRGRGGPYSNFGGQNAQFNASMSNNSFGSSKAFFNDRQRSQQHGLANGSQQNRMPLRSPSLPTSGNVYGGVYAFPGDINTMYGYQAVNPAPMSAMPYQQYMEPFSLMSMLSMQLEYYFSVDNMCKDMFLRKQMDSQGFVPLNVLASFKRVKSLTEDFELLRHVSRQLRNVECQTGEDGIDRLRPREKWQQWVLPVDQREPAAQYDGTVPAGKTDENTPITSHTETAINGSARQFVPNGVADGPKTSLSSTAPEFMPSMPTAVNEIANVGYPLDHPNSPDDSTMSFFSSSSSFPMDSSIIDTSYSACGLDSQSEPPFLSDLESVAPPMSYDAEYFPYQPGGADWLMSQYLAKAHQPPKSKGKARSFQETSNHVPKTSNMFHNQNFKGRGQSMARRYSPSMPYHFWSLSLTNSLKTHFDSHLYNEFRRSALDDLLTRHVDKGFNELMQFYRNCLLHRCSVPDSVMCDMYHLSQEESSHHHTLVLNMIRGTIASGQMKSYNQRKASKYFNTQHGTPGEKLS
ncbi:Winged helix-turn-helix transcription repressor DNA-binding [Penicillium paradoxum]|uniref:Winged helix-turn-helix transcription repressor DNA-binding n=1 Tax=Penicillium paradoxum TaxID=176176 RepID=UPI002546EE22|nr:Winged helix-turn-helix transcription repressor DNA-binding [Penicillium paradoxum]KAJ5794281.1 Winged helix-turn-helix transcription repressor DNA-binding [Penicillium paradoxum]